MYKTQSPDTSEAAERAQFEMLRRAGARRRLELARAQTASATRLAQRRIARSHPQWSEQEIGLHWTALMYGEEAAHRLRRELQRRSIEEIAR